MVLIMKRVVEIKRTTNSGVSGTAIEHDDLVAMTTRAWGAQDLTNAGSPSSRTPWLFLETWGSRKLGVLTIKAPLLEVYIGAPDFGNPHT